MPDKTIEEEILEFSNSQWGEKTWEGLGLKLAEESGEVAGELVKIPEGRATWEGVDLEVGDTLIVLSQIAARRGTTLEALRAKRFVQIQERAASKLVTAASPISPERDHLFTALADLIQFCKVEMGWEFFRADMEIAENPTTSMQNARKIRERLHLLSTMSPEVAEACKCST